MTKALQYLEAIKVEELVQSLREQGYSVEIPNHPDTGYDLLATKGEQKIAYQVKARASLTREADKISRTRAQTRAEGIQEFRLVVVNPPHKTRVDIENLELILSSHLAGQMPSELASLSSNTRLEGVSVVEVDSIEVSAVGIHVTGSGTVEVELNYGGGADRDGITSGDSFPMNFDVRLGLGLQPDPKHKLVIEVDTSSFSE